MTVTVTTSTTAPIIINTIPTKDGLAIGTLTLNDPKALNALSIDMCKLMAKQLSQWQTDDSIVAIILKGSGNKAFCAGGNIRKLYDSMINQPPMPNPYAEDFFSNEYHLYKQMNEYKKPIILWANGIVMGGGMGLMAMCSHRVVTETTRFAMPEISIGLYPDATGSWFLQRMPAKSGLFLGLTGAQCNGADAIVSNMAEYAIKSDDYESLVTALINATWSTSKNLKHTASETLASIYQSDLFEHHHIKSNILTHWQLINQITNMGDIHAINKAMQDPKLSKEYEEEKWITHAINSYKNGCPVTAALTFELFSKVPTLSLAQILYLELNVSLHCANNPDFKEGVRALLVDKDKNPKWSKTLAECTEDYISSHFESPYAHGNHPFDEWFNT